MDWDVQEADIDGIKVISIYAPELPSVEAVVRINVGSMDEYPNHKRGVAHFFEHLPFEGTDKFAGSIYAHADKINAFPNACTSYENTDFSIRVPVQHWRHGMEILSQFIQHATFDEAVVLREGKTILREMHERPFTSGLDRVLVEKLRALHNYHSAYEAIIGISNSIQSITRPDLISFRNEFYNRENSRIVVRGNVPPQDVFANITEFFGDLPHGKPVAKTVVNFMPGFKAIPMGLYDNMEGTVYFTESQQGFEQPSEIALDWMTNIYFSNPSGPIMRDLRNDKRLVYGIYPEYVRFSRCNFFSVGVVSSAPEAEDRLASLVRHATDLVEGKIEDGAWDYLRSNIVQGVWGFYASNKYPEINIIHNTYGRTGRLIDPEEDIKMAEGILREDFIKHVRQTFARVPSYFAYGAVEGLMSPQRFDEIISPLSQLARSFTP